MRKLESGYYSLYEWLYGTLNYEFNSKGVLKIRTLTGIGSALYKYYVAKKQNENLAEIVAQTTVGEKFSFVIDAEKKFKKEIAKLMIDNPALVADVEAKKYKLKDIQEIFLIYNSSKK